MDSQPIAKNRRLEIIEAAQRCLLRTGYNSTSMDDIVEESGLSKGTIYWHFENKKDLFLALFEHMLGQMIPEFIALLKIDAPADEKIRMLVGSLSLADEDNMELMALPLNLMTDMLADKDFMAYYRKTISILADETRQILEDGVRDGVFRELDAEAVSWALMSIYDGALLYTLFDMPFDIQQQSQVLADLMLDGLRARNAAAKGE